MWLNDEAGAKRKYCHNVEHNVYQLRRGCTMDPRRKRCC